MTDITDTLIQTIPDFKQVAAELIGFSIVALLISCGVLVWRWCDRHGLL